MWKAPLRGLLLVLVVAGVAMLSLGLWARHTVYDENRFVAVVGGLSADPDVQAVAVDRVMGEIDKQVADRTATAGLSPTIAITYQMFRPQIQQGLVAALGSPEYKPYWNQALRELHGPLTALLKGNQTPYLKQTGNQVQVNLFSAYELAQQNLPPRAASLLGSLDIASNSLWVTVLEGDTLVEIQQYVRLFNRILAVGIIVSVLAAVGYVLLSRRKLRAVVWVMLAIAVGLLVQRAALELGRRQLVDSLGDTNQQGAAAVFYNTLLGDLRRFELYALIVAIGAAVVIYLADRYVVQKKVPAADAAI